MAETATPEILPDIEHEEKTRDKTELEPGYLVICWNDPVNLMDYVTHVFQTVFGWPKAKELLYTGRVVHAEEAERIGLLNQIVPSAKLRECAIEMGQMIAKNDPRMVQGLKRLLHEGAGMSLHERYEFEDEARATWLLAGHPRDGFKDFLARKGKR